MSQIPALKRAWVFRFHPSADVMSAINDWFLENYGGRKAWWGTLPYGNPWQNRARLVVFISRNRLVEATHFKLAFGDDIDYSDFPSNSPWPS